MSGKMTRGAYEQMIAGNLAWLYGMPRTLEREHIAEIVQRSAEHEYGATARPLAEWHEADGPALWWRFPVEEAPYCGMPLDSDWPGYHTHWTPIVVPEAP